MCRASWIFLSLFFFSYFFFKILYNIQRRDLLCVYGK
jgi:hypothetical protein